MSIDIHFFISKLRDNKKIFESFIHGISTDQSKWKPAPEQWSIVEVLNHLYDEEREDFRPRLELLLFSPTIPWPPMDPPQWVIEREYQKRDLGQSLQNFLQERDQSLAWLQSLSSPQWENRCERPWGFITAGDMITSWLAHDFLHLRQLTKLQFHYLSSVVQPYTTRYAGQW